MHSARRRGFTLIELAIVLIIVSLVAAAITAGRSMLQQSAKRAVLGEADKYIKAIQLFTDKYTALPGDFDHAEEFWGADSGCPGVVFNTVAKKATCNGNGGGTIGNGNQTASYEWYRAWQHMANAGVLEGQFSGVAGHVAGSQLIGTSVPKSAYADGGYTLLFVPNTALGTESFAMSARHVLAFGAVDPACASGITPADCVTHYKLLTPTDAAEIDQKVDDGRPGTGTILSRPSTSVLNPSCSDGTDAATAQYNLVYTDRACGLLFDVRH